VYRYIDEQYDEHVAQLQRWIRQRSVGGLREQEKFFADLLFALSGK
jgi:hypothetical protein